MSRPKSEAERIALEIARLTCNGGNAVGGLGETLVAAALRERGYRVTKPRRAHRGDLNVRISTTTLRIEVKTSRRGKDGCWRFNLYKYWQGRECANHRNADYVVLVCVTQAGRAIPYVIPVAAIENLSSITIPKHPDKYAGKYAHFQQDWRSLRVQP